MYQEVEKQLHRNFDELAPNVLEHILAAEPAEILSEEELFSELYAEPVKSPATYSLAHFRYARLAVAAVLVCILTLGYHMWKTAPVGSVTIEADTSVCLSLNRANQIVSVELEDPGLLNRDDLEGQSLEDGLNLILDKFTEDADSSDGSVISIKYQAGSGNKSVDQTLHKAVDRYSSKKKIEVDGNSQSVSAKADAEEEASRNAADNRSNESDSSAERVETDIVSEEATTEKASSEEAEATTEMVMEDKASQEEVGTDIASTEQADTDQETADKDYQEEAEPQEAAREQVPEDQTVVEATEADKAVEDTAVEDKNDEEEACKDKESAEQIDTKQSSVDKDLAEEAESVGK